MNILFVCTGNTCRSPMAQGLFKSILKEKNITDIKVKSAGIAALEESPPSEYAIEALSREDVDISDYRAVRLDDELIEWADYIYVMTDGHRAALRDIAPEYSGKIKVLSEDGIDDPYGMPLETYLRTAADIKKALTKIAEDLE